jgi:hypothetical protein
MFQFPAFASALLPITLRWGYPIRKSTDQRLFAPTRGLSQLTTSFIASGCLGIPHALLFTFFLLKCLHSITPLPVQLYHVNELCASGFTPRPDGLGRRCLFFRLAPVENIGVEPMTPCLQSRCSSQLS